jgi:ubiquitin C-terminal hydrolase
VLSSRKSQLFDFVTNSFISEKVVGKDRIEPALSLLELAPPDALRVAINKLTSLQLPLRSFEVSAAKLSEFDITGLVNLGATCYLNSILQQLFAIPAVRKMVISYAGDDAFLRQLKRLFSRMRDFRVAAGSTQKLVDQWVSWDGEKLNPHQQQDATEFCQMLIDTMQILGPSEMTNLFQVKTRMTIEGLDEPWQGQHDEQNCVLLLDVANCPDLATSLDRFHSVNYFRGRNQYYAESLQRKINAKGVAWLSSLPDHLLIVLKRFEYDFATQSRKKINSVLDFPLELDLAAHCIPNVDFETQYRLTGVILHSGSAMFGHCFSYVLRGDTWFECNDTRIRQITVEQVHESASGRKSQSTSAFVLVYLRGSVVEVDDAPIDEALREKIKQERDTAIQSRIFCNSALADFASALAALDSPETKTFALKYVVTTLCHASITERASGILLKLKNFDQALSIILDLDLVPAIIKCPSTSFREAICKYLQFFSPNYELFDKLKAMIPAAVKQISRAKPFFQLLCNVVAGLDDKTKLSQIVLELQTTLVTVATEIDAKFKKSQAKTRREIVTTYPIQSIAQILNSFGAAWDELVETNELVQKAVWEARLPPADLRKLFEGHRDFVSLKKILCN